MPQKTKVKVYCTPYASSRLTNKPNLLAEILSLTSLLFILTAQRPETRIFSFKKNNTLRGTLPGWVGGERNVIAMLQSHEAFWKMTSYGLFPNFAIDASESQITYTHREHKETGTTYQKHNIYLNLKFAKIYLNLFGAGIGLSISIKP